MRFLFFALLLIGLVSCARGPGVELTAPQILNGSHWDPKAKQRPGESYSAADFSALRRNGARAYIARTSKGSALDRKTASFLRAAHREGLLLGTYHYYLPRQSSPEAQAEAYVRRVRRLKAQLGLQSKPVLLVGDFDSHTQATEMLAFLQRVETLTGVRPLVYLENSDILRRELQAAPPSIKSQLRRYPLWIALYGHVPPPNTLVDQGRPLTPERNTRSYGIWRDYALWQYGGVMWEKDRSTPKVYRYAHFQAAPYFGRLDRPVERNVFKGSNLDSFWNQHSL